MFGALGIRLTPLVAVATVMTACTSPKAASPSQQQRAPLADLSPCSADADTCAREAKCATGDAESCNQAGSHYYGKGRSTPDETARMLTLFVRGCDLRNAIACLKASELLSNLGTVPDVARAEALGVRGCELSPQWCGTAAQRFELGWDRFGNGRDMKRARELYVRACTAGNDLSCRAVKRNDCEAAGGLPLTAIPVVGEMLNRTEVISACGGGAIFRFDLDITGDGMPELFLASSQSAGNAGLTWAIFSSSRPAAACGYFAAQFFHDLAYRFDGATKTFQWYHRMGGGEGIFYSAPVTATGIGEPDDGVGMETNTPEFEKRYAELTGWNAPPVAYADLEELARNPTGAVWKNTRTDQPISVAPLTEWRCTN